jgi:hypothetical protein
LVCVDAGEGKITGFTLLFWSQLFTAAVLGGLGTGILYIPLVLNHPVDVAIIRLAVTAAVIGGAFIAAASVFAKMAANTFAGIHPYAKS